MNKDFEGYKFKCTTRYDLSVPNLRPKRDAQFYIDLKRDGIKGAWSGGDYGSGESYTSYRPSTWRQFWEWALHSDTGRYISPGRPSWEDIDSLIQTAPKYD